MHVLTKIFIVLVSLLAVLLVPLVVVYATNEDNYKSKLNDAVSQRAVAEANLSATNARHASELAQKDSQIDALTRDKSRLQADISQMQADLTAARSRLAEAENAAQMINAKLATLAESTQAGTRLTQSLVEEVRELRDSELNAQRRLVETEEALREMSRELEVVDAARRSLQEEVQRLTELEAKLTQTLGVYVRLRGELDPDQVSTGQLGEGTLPDRNITATVTDVRSADGRTLVEINAGQRDGLKLGWELTIGDNGDYVGLVRIIDVDINKATGVVVSSLSSGSQISVGQRAYAWAGR